MPIAVLFAVLAAGCLDTPSPTGPGAAQGVAVTVEPPSALVPARGQQGFAATVTGTADIAVTWQVLEAGCGAVTASGLYTAPAGAGTCHLVATSHADPSRSGAAIITVQAPPPPVTIAVTPALVTVAASSQTTFSATVIGSVDTAVTWLVQEASCGTITAGGVYTAPATAATCHVVATSHADPSKSAAAAVTVNSPVPIAVSVSPGSTSAFGCRTVSFTATVTGTSNTAVAWTVAEPGGGTVSAAGLYTAPAIDGTFHVVATSAASPSASASAAIVVTTQILAVTVSPASFTVPPGGSVQFTATVTTSCGTSTALAQAQAPAG